MPDTQVRALDDSIHTTNEWLKELEGLLGTDRHGAYKALRGYLHTVRDCIGVDEAVDLSAQLPLLLKGVFVHSWSPSKTPRRMNADEFLAEVHRTGELIGPSDPDPVYASRVMTAFLRQRTGGEMQQVIDRLQRDVRDLIDVTPGAPVGR